MVSGAGPSKVDSVDRSLTGDLPMSARSSARRGEMLPGCLFSTCSRSGKQEGGFTAHDVGHKSAIGLFVADAQQHCC
jgi:hypothetical protein